MFHESQPQENDGDREQTQTDGVKKDGGMKDIDHVDADGRHQQRVHQPIKDIPDSSLNSDFNIIHTF